MQQTPTLTVRLTCFFYEILVTVSVLLIGFLAPQIILGMFGHIVTSPRLLVAHIFLLLMLYFVWQWTSGGQTLPMKTWRIKLISITGAPISRGQALLRFALAWPSIGFFGVGLLWAIFDRDKQFLHDRLSYTRLIRIERSPH